MNLFRRSLKKSGLPPGTLTIPEGITPVRPTVTLFEYDTQILKETAAELLESEIKENFEGIYWLNIDGLGDIKLFRRIGEQFDIHDLSLEDILNIDQRPKIEEHEGYFLIVVKMISWNTTKSEIDVEQVSLILRNNMVLTFQEKPGDVFTSIRERLRNNKGRIRREGADYLAFALLDAIVDNYFVVFEQLGEQITACENEVIHNPTASTSAKIHALRNRLIMLRRAIWPLREVANELKRVESDMFRDETKPYFKDLYDHTLQIIEAMETYRDVLSGLLDGYQNAVSNRMNEIMKILTIISTLFIPLSFLAGLYGMNFKNMPELEWQWGYHMLLAVMGTLAAGLLLFFRKKRWI
jgi:magnesium transporter